MGSKIEGKTGRKEEEGFESKGGTFFSQSVLI
jgi:hypothetical protein